jgi:hypothetical protein
MSHTASTPEKTPPAADASAAASRRWLRSWPWWLTLGPWGLLCAFGLYGVASQWGAAGGMQRRLNQMRLEGLPLDNAELATWWQDQTADQGLPDWLAALDRFELALRSIGKDHRLPYVGQGHKPPLPVLAGGEPWSDRETAEQLLMRLRPSISQLQQACQAELPIRSPVAFDGARTSRELHEELRAVSRAVALELDTALVAGDLERSMEMLRLIDSLSERSNWHLLVQGELVQVATRSFLYQGIARLLGSGLGGRLSDSQLDWLSQNRDDYVERLRGLVASEQGVLLADLLLPVEDAERAVPVGRRLPWVLAWNLVFPASRLQLLEYNHAWFQLSAVSFPQLLEKLDHAPESPIALRRDFAPWMRLMTPAYEQLVAYYARDYLWGRLCRVAVEVQRFRSTHGVWPERLEQLEPQGVTADEWRTLSGHRFMYRVIDDRAYLWSNDPENGNRPPTPHPARPDRYGQLPWNLIVIGSPR